MSVGVGEGPIYKASCKQLLLKHRSLHHPSSQDHSTTRKAAAFPEITKEPKEMESILKTSQ